MSVMVTRIVTNVGNLQIQKPCGQAPERTNVMFGRMMVTPIVQVGADADLQASITALLRAAE